jgi:hypothetical protein
VQARDKRQQQPVAAGEDIDMMSFSGKTCDVRDLDVLTAAVDAAGSGERRRMLANECDFHNGFLSIRVLISGSRAGVNVGACPSAQHSAQRIRCAHGETNETSFGSVPELRILVACGSEGTVVDLCGGEWRNYIGGVEASGPA